MRKPSDRSVCANGRTTQRGRGADGTLIYGTTNSIGWSASMSLIARSIRR
jgi:hypothetical protein